MPRRVWIATAVAWAISSLLFLAGTSVTSSVNLEWLAVLAYSVAWILLAPAIVSATRLVPSRASRVVGAVIAVAAVVAGIANLVSNLGAIDAAATWYVDGILLATILLVPLAYLFARDRSNPLAVLALLVFLGIGFTAGGLGGLLVTVAFGALAYRTTWFLPRARPALPDGVIEVEPAA